MKTNNERAYLVREKYKQAKRARRRRNRAIAVCAACCVAVTAVNLTLFLPYSTTPPDVGRYATSAYYPVIKKLNEATYQAPEYKNNFERWFGDISFGCGAKGSVNNYMGAATPEVEFEATDSSTALAPEYVETTDNQVAGVIEGDLIKRTDEHVFYLSEADGDYRLRVYSIAQAESKKVAEYVVEPESERGWFTGEAELYLSTDCTQITLLAKYNEYTRKDSYTVNGYTVLIGLDVSDVSAIEETGRTYLSGSYNTSRLVDGTFYVVNDFFVRNNPNFDAPEEWLPQYGPKTDRKSVAAEDIVAPETVTTAQYTLVCAIDEKTLETTDSAAFLSYTGTLYASENRIFAARGYTQKENAEEGGELRTAKTEIACLTYGDGELDFVGSFSVNGSVKDQYAMDEYEGTLRVVTTCAESLWKEYRYYDYVSMRREWSETNVSLYVIDLADLSLKASVEKFAPEGETAESVRFSGTKAYVCTAEVIVLTDPVFAFDLSDLQNITWTDTGTIEGYSTSLVDFGNGFLLGIGYDGARDLKIEIYTETETSVESVDSVTRSADFSEEYKSYLIDRKNGLVGIGITEYGGKGESLYVLYAFNGYELTELVSVQLRGDNGKKRAVFADGWLYVFGEEADGFAAVKAFKE